MAAKKKPAAKNSQALVPYLLYNDVAAALVWLAKAFGFQEFGDRFHGADGAVAHAAMQLKPGGEIFMMGCPGKKYKNPKQLGVATQLQHVNVENLDAHYKRAKKAGARIIEEPKDTFYGDRRYGVEDPEGHKWYFAQHVRDVSSAEMKKALRSKKEH